MPTNDLVVADLTCPPGASARGRIVVGYEQDGTEVALPVLLMNGASPGPTVYLGGLIHGDEPSGAEVIRRVMRERVQPADLAGRLIAFPVQNPLAFRTSTYHSLEDGLNANRIFPGDPTETLTNRAVAAISTHAIDQSDYVLDLHCNARDSILFNFVRWSDSAAGRESVTLSTAFGFTTIISEAKRQGYGFEERLVGLLADMSLAAGKPTLTVELTPNYDFDSGIIEGGVRGVLNVLRHLHMLEGAPEPQVGLPIIQGVLGPQLRVTPERGGFVHPQVPIGTWVEAGQSVVLIRDPWGDVIEEIRSPAAGYVLAYPRHGNHAAASGDVVVFVAPIHPSIT
ncbi:MAG TPA: succinylglutamate desuccinylase/aspartoacylase family protein [Candidatus Limnocylindrales bacterium]|nr:succinylglutamate desuccinylase/aspartoacylase family protein [Candidatus Limnocylindrales bacterium]